jgi:predicted dehydrogenase
MRIIQIGAGFWGTTWLGIVAESRACRLEAIVDPDEAALARAGQAAGVPASRRFTSLADAIRLVEAEAALVVVPPELHAAIALEAIAAGLHCLVEKPFATRLDDAEMVVEQARRADRTVMVSQNYRFTSGARTVRRLVRDGELGRIAAVSIRFARAPSIQLSGFRAEIEEPLVLDMAIHHVDAIRGVLGLEPVAVFAKTFNPPWSPYPGNAAAVIQLETEDGAVIAYVGNLADRGPPTAWSGAWEVQGELGSIAWEGDRVVRHGTEPPATRLRRLRGPRTDTGTAVSLERVVASERAGSLAEFAAAVREAREPESSGQDNLSSLALALAAIQSSRRREVIDLASPAP